VFVSAWAVYKWVTKQKFHDKFVVYRALAENLRILFYLHLLNRYPKEPFESYWKMDDTFQWINAVIRQLRRGESAAPPLPLHQALKLVRSNWVQGQATYYKKQKQNQNHLHDRQQRFVGLATGAIIAGILILTAVDLLTLTGADRIIDSFRSTWVRNNLLLIFSLLGWWIALVNNLYKKLFAPETIHDYKQMHAIFEAVGNGFPPDPILDRYSETSPDSLDPVIDELHRLARYAVNENDRWTHVKLGQKLELNI
jgi:hypothetical protein